MLGDEADVDEEAYDAAGAIAAAHLSWIRPGNRKHKDWDNTILGTLHIDGTTLTVDVNSAKRRDRITKEIGKRLGAAATLIETNVADITAALEQRRAAGGTPPTPPPGPQRTPEIEALEAEWGRKHWEAWVDTKVPALGGRTPRQAAKTERGRERLEALLSDVERHSERDRSAFRPDLGQLRRKLGLV